jgi:hypothetical protein
MEEGASEHPQEIPRDQGQMTLFDRALFMMTPGCKATALLTPWGHHKNTDQLSDFYRRTFAKTRFTACCRLAHWFIFAASQRRSEPTTGDKAMTVYVIADIKVTDDGPN